MTNNDNYSNISPSLKESLGMPVGYEELSLEQKEFINAITVQERTSISLDDILDQIKEIKYECHHLESDDAIQIEDSLQDLEDEVRYLMNNK
jgi:hypothetical protein